MTCKDCIHYDVCYAVKAVGENQESDKYCMSFKNKADYAEVKHGYWKRKEGSRTYWYECSVCGEEIPRNKYGGWSHVDYCPN